jgi:hypothetical protein
MIRCEDSGIITVLITPAHDIDKQETAADTMNPDAIETEKYQCEREADRIQRFFRRPFFLSLTIGIPFCTYKMLLGITAVRIGTAGNFPLVCFGWIITGWAGLDLIMNLSRVVLDLVHKPNSFEYCSIAQLGRFFHAPMAFLAIDTLLSFTIICFMLWSGWIATLTPVETIFWVAATTLNLISLSIVSLYNEIRIT